MIAVDFSQIFLANIFADCDAKICAASPCNESRDTILYYTLNSLRYNYVENRDKYGEMVIAVDARRSWRKDIFPNYKCNRKAKRDNDDSGIDWPFVFETMNYVVPIIREHLPFLVIEVEGAEADDIIGVLAKDISQKILVESYFGDTEPEPMLIISSDKDNYQLHRFKNVNQWNPHTKNLVRPEHGAKKALLEKIVKGDAGDGVMNIRSPDNVFVDKIRQKPITSAYLTEFFESKNPIDVCKSEEERKNFIRNEQLVSYEFTPKEIVDKIVLEYNNQKAKEHSKFKLMSFFVDNKMPSLYSKIGDFYHE